MGSTPPSLAAFARGMNKEEKQTVVVKVGESTSYKTYDSILY